MWDETFIDVLSDRVEACRAPAAALQKIAHAGTVQGDIGYFFNDATGQVALQARGETPGWEIKNAQDKLINTYDDKYYGLLTQKEAASGDWVKLAYSPTIRRVGELLNFFPGEYPGGIPNAPSPLAAMLTSGMLGAGVGYGGGMLAEQLMPRQYRGRLRKTTALLGGLGGASLGVPWAVANSMNGKSLLDPSPHDVPIGSEAAIDSRGIPPFFGENQSDPQNAKLQQAGIDLPAQLGLHTRRKFGSAFGGPFDVNTDALGRTLWRSGASPDTQVATMGAMYAAQSMPDDDARSGVVTGNQLGQLAVSAGKGYVSGLLVGAALNAATGLPMRNAGLYGAALGIIQQAVPKLFS
jgi:hypothetical protein